MSSKQKKSIHMGLDSDSSDDSDFDEDDDPDKIEVPGGFKSMGFLGSMPNLDEPGTSKAPKSFQSIAKPLLPGTSLLRPVKKEQPGYEVVPIPPGSNLFGPRIVKMGPGGPFPMDQMRAMVANGVPHMAGIQQLINMNKLLPNANPLVGMRIPFNPADPASYFSGVKPDEDGTVEEDEDLGVVETYADYMPSKLKLGVKHPDPVVETATLSSVAPPEIWYHLSLPQETIKTGALSALQLEAIVYACQQHENFLGNAQRAGFLVGDGAGVGKGRTIAGLIFENYLKGRKRAIWVSISNDLKYDAERDLGDIGAGKIPVYAINKFKYAKISSDVNGNVKKGVLFSTYSSLIGESQSNTKYKTRLKQILQWCGEDFDGLIVFDECHRAKNLAPSGSSKPTKTGLTVLELQNKLPKARVVYASATGASEPKNMAYMVRLGLWGPGTPFPQFTDFINTVDKRGIGAMEIVAMEMKLRGMYIARQLSFHGVTFKVDEVPLSKEFVNMYDDAVKLWVELMQKFTEAVEMVAAEAKMRKHMWSQFWSAHQRFFKYLCIAAKVKHAVRVAREAVKVGKCVVIGLQSTGEARTLDQLERDEGELSDFVSTAKGVLQTLIEKHFPAPDRNRVLKLLGLPYHQKTVLDELGINVDQESSSSNGKRKPVRTASLITSKKMKLELNDSDDSEPDGKKGSDSEFEVNSDDEESEENSDGGSNSDDFNPFGGGDDSDDVADPWLVRSKKKKKTKTKQNKKNGKTAKLKKSEPVTAPVRLPTANRLQISLPPKPAAAAKEAAPNPDMGVASVPTQAMLDKAWAMKEEMLSKLEYLGPKLPANTLDQLIDELGGPENVAEMTGRKGRVIQNEDGQIQYESRSETDVPLETLNITEKQRFMDGDKDVAIISEAASSGISLQADRRAINQKRRVHITLELPWSADRAIQQFGRTHRSNQVSAPEYLFLISDLAGERRFASIVAKRLESMGALTHGDRRATESRDLSQFNIDNRYGRAALEATMKAIMGYETPVVPPPEDYRGNFFHDVAVGLVGVGLIVNNDAVPGSLTFDKDYNNISKFLNRILGMPVDLQNRLFKYFTDTLNAIIKQAKRAGRYDMGILDLGSGSENVKQKKLYKFVRRTTTGSARIELHVVEVERGMAFEEAKEKWGDLFGSNEGFYISQQPFRSGRRYAYLAVSTGSSLQRRLGEKSEQHQLFTLYKPNLGQNLKPETLLEVRKNYKLVTPDEAEPVWNELYDMAKTMCTHTYQNGSCKSRVVGLECQVGLRQRTFNVLCGSVLSVWSKVEELVTRSGFNQKMQVVRMRSEGGTKIVGIMIPDGCLQELITILAKDAESTSEKQF